MKKVFTQNAANINISKQIAREIFERLSQEENFSVFLEGGLGAGKTFLVREILKHFGIKEEIVSPTYIYVNEYETEDDQLFAHFDFYRLESPHVFFEKGFQEIASDESISCFVEWDSKISPNSKASYSGKKFVIRIEFGAGVGMRKIHFLEK